MEGKVVSINKAIEGYGFSREQIIGKKITEFIPKEYWPQLTVNKSILEQGKWIEGEIEVNAPIGKRNAEFRSNPVIRDNEVVAIQSVLRDITDRKKNEQAILESQQKFSALFSANPEAAVFVDTDFHVIEANQRFSALFGYSLDEIKGKVVTDLIVPGDAEEESKTIRRKILLEPVEIVTRRKRKDGSQVPLFMSGGPVFVGDKVIGLVMVYKDISDIIAVQDALSKALSTAELLNEKLSIVGGFVRHDVRNKLSAINGNVYLAKKQAGDNVATQKCLDQIKLSSDNIVRILDYSKTFESLGNEKLALTDVGAAFDQAVSLFTDLKGVKIVNDCKGFSVLADSMLTTMFHNLIDNSMKYAEKLAQIKAYTLTNADGSRSIVYEDDGVGIDVETKKHLFEKGFGKGTGLGLYLIKKATDVYGWKIEETGMKWHGARFVMTIPKTSEKGQIEHQVQS
jgi:PAS domain S-box-containing protein